ncbi:MAG: hypothetical protein EB000_01405, partial [Alphaproteobacteria bacterium]|nr:hypothetical protein [Alphaproteobacteria bacterium]
MKKLISSFLRKILYKIDLEEYKYTKSSKKEETRGEVLVQSENLEIKKEKSKDLKPKKPKGPKLPELSPQERAARDITEMMEVPFLALSKNRRAPIIYEKHDGPNMMKVKVSRHTGHFLASIYDWDIV